MNEIDILLLCIIAVETIILFIQLISNLRLLHHLRNIDIYSYGIYTITASEMSHAHFPEKYDVKDGDDAGD